MVQYSAIMVFGQTFPDELSEDERQEMNVSTQQHEQCVAQCPSCGHVADFSYGGEQHWPEKVARLAGIAPIVALWLCGNCGSTISEHDLEF